jgi:hypothetical protein
VYDRGNSGVPGERESVKERKMMGRFRCGNEQKEKTGTGWKERCRMCYEERETIEHMRNGCSEIRKRERKKRGEIQNEDGREIRKIKG